MPGAEARNTNKPKMMDIPAIRQLIREDDPQLLETSKEFKAAVVLLAIGFGWTEYNKRNGGKQRSRERLLMHVTGYPLSLIYEFVNNWKKAKVLQDWVIHCSWGPDCGDDELSAISFWLDVMVGVGTVNKYFDEKEGENNEGINVQISEDGKSLSSDGNGHNEAPTNKEMVTSGDLCSGGGIEGRTTIER